MRRFKNKVVTITGAGSGMGRAYAIEFAKLGAKLSLNDWNADNLAQTKEIARKQGAKAIFTKAFDVSKKEEMFAFAEETKNTLGNTHIIINNAGIAGRGNPFCSKTEEEFDQVIQVNLYGVIYGCRAFLPQLLANNEGAVVNVASVFGLVGIPGVSAYCASKFAVRGFTECLMAEFHKSPISIHCVMPGGIDTNIADNAENAEEFKKNLKTPPKAIAKYVIKCIKNKKQNIIYGHGSSTLNFVSKYLPAPIKNIALWSRLKKNGDMIEKYRPFNSLMD